jgi:hypothetical protein
MISSVRRRNNPVTKRPILYGSTYMRSKSKGVKIIECGMVATRGCGRRKWAAV